MSNTPTPVAETDGAPIMTKRDMLKALEALEMDDYIIVAVFPPRDDEEAEGFSETETPGTAPVTNDASDDDEDDRDYVECSILDSEVTEGEEGTESAGKKALLLTVDLDVEMNDTEEDGEEDDEPEPA